MAWRVGKSPVNGAYALVNPEGERVHIYGPESEDRRHARWHANLLNLPLSELERIDAAIGLLGKVFE